MKGQVLTRAAVECVRVEPGRHGWNARFHLVDGGPGPRGVVSVTRLVARPRLRGRYVVVLLEDAPEPARGGNR